MNIFIILTLFLLIISASFGVGYGVYRLVRYLIKKDNAEKIKEE